MSLKIGNLNTTLVTKKALRQVREDLIAARGGILFNEVTYDLASLADAAGATADVSVPGADLGDFAFAAHGLSVQGISVTAYVSAADVVSVRFQNETAGTLDLASTTLRVFVVKRNAIRHVFGSDALFASATVDVASLVDAAGATSSGITVTGAALGDFVFFSHGVSLAGISASAYVQAADTVEVRFQNESGGTLDLASTTTRVVVIPKASMSKAFFGRLLQGAATYDASSLADGAGETTTVTCTGASIGDYAMCSFSLDGVDLLMSAYVSAANTVSVRVQNESTGTVNLSSGTLRVAVLPRGVISSAGVVGLTS